MREGNSDGFSLLDLSPFSRYSTGRTFDARALWLGRLANNPLCFDLKRTLSTYLPILFIYPNHDNDQTNQVRKPSQGNEVWVASVAEDNAEVYLISCCCNRHVRSVKSHLQAAPSNYIRRVWSGSGNESTCPRISNSQKIHQTVNEMVKISQNFLDTFVECCESLALDEYYVKVCLTKIS